MYSYTGDTDNYRVTFIMLLVIDLYEVNQIILVYVHVCIICSYLMLFWVFLLQPIDCQTWFQAIFSQF